MSELGERWDELDDGTRDLQELKEALDCHASTIIRFRTRWLRERRTEDKERCIRCTFIATERVPFVENEYAKIGDEYVIVDDVEPDAIIDTKGKLCLWCWLDVEGIDHRKFYESGAWMDYVNWRPGHLSEIEALASTLRNLAQEKMEELGHDVIESADAIGCNRNTWRGFVTNYKNRGPGLGNVSAEACCRYLGIEPNARGLAKRFGIHHRKISQYVKGW